MATVKQWTLKSELLKQPFALLILNQKILQPDRAVELWKNATIRVLVDGGANQWQEIMEKSVQGLAKPHLVCGDFDSIQPEVLQNHRKCTSTKVVVTEDQNNTDFTKAVKEILLLIKEQNVEIRNIFAFVENSGRLDHIFANIETLFLAGDILPKDLDLYMLSSDTLTWLLPAGKHEIILPDEIDKDTHIGLIPVGNEVKHVTTEGLKWNLNNQPMAFGKLISTSNAVALNATCISVQCDDTLLWTMEYFPKILNPKL